MSKYIPVGISQNELFMTDDVDHKDCTGQMIFCVIRPITQGALDYLQSDDYIYETCDEFWRERVRNDRSFTQGLDDFVELAKSDMCFGDEDFIFKDDSFCDVFDDDRKIYQPLPEWNGYCFDGEYNIEYDENDHIMPLTLRQFVDMWVEYNTGEAIGTWEASGCFHPYSEKDYYAPIKFDYVLNEKIANIWYKQAKL